MQTLSRPGLRRLFGLLGLVSPLALGGCLEPTNPCDPDTAADERGTSSLSGVVKDQGGAPLAGVSVVIPGHATPAITAEDGSFGFDELLPSESDDGGYEVIALADEPAIGGRTTTRPLGCQDELSGIELVVALPPASPEVEIVQATSPERLFVAFAAASGSTRYTVELRAPFETWQPAAIVTDSERLMDESAALSGQATVSDEDARAFCAAFRYAHPDLANDNARCAGVLGILAGEDVLPLAPYGSYEVRVRAEALLATPLAKSQRLPEVVRSAPTGVPGELSLVPLSFMPVMLDPDPALHAEKLSALDIGAVVPVSAGRFAMLGSGTDASGMMIVGDAQVTAPDLYDGSADAPEGAMAFDSSSPEAAAEVSENSGSGLAILPAGKWVRVWKRYLDPATGAAHSEVEKIFIGEEQRSESHGEQPEPSFAFDVSASGLIDELSAFSWLVQPEGSIAGDEAYNPPDGYFLLLRTGFVMLEHESAGGLADGGESLLGVFADGLADGGRENIYGGGPNDPNAMTTGVCQKLGDGALGVSGAIGERSVRVCLDLEGALRQAVELSDVEILPAEADATAPSETFHVLSDALGDRVLAVRSDYVLGKAELPLADLLHEVRTGVEPRAMASARVLDCADSAHRPVVLVANHGSFDVSVLGVVGDADGETRVDEIGIVGMPGAPVRFLDDPDGASCRDPYTWVVLEDGRVLPLDMREGHLGVARCGDEPCAVRGFGRAPVGAVSRDESGQGRVLVGGRGTLGEIGFLRPSAGASEAGDE